VPRATYSLQIVETGQFLVFGANTSPSNHFAQTSPTDPALVSPSNIISISNSGGYFKFSPSTYTAYLSSTAAGVLEVTPSVDASNGSDWVILPVANTIGYFTLQNRRASDYITSWTTTGSAPGVTVKFIPK
jgi:hypothetical protein